MSINNISPAGQPAPERARFASEPSSSHSVHDSVELSRGNSAADNGLIPPMMHRIDGQAGNAPAGRTSAQSSEPQDKKSVSVEINKWVVAEDNTSYLINTGGCGAIKIFVDGGESSYSIVFHSFGSQDSKDAAGQIGNYILSRKEKPESVRILNIQPFGISASVNNTVNVISDMIKEEGSIKINGHAVCLNNIDGEKYSKFICLDLEGTEKQILDRYDNLILKSREMSDDERAMKIKLFQSIPFNLRTTEFLRKWSTLSLEEARQHVDGLNIKSKPFGKLRSKLGSTLAKVRNSFTGRKSAE
ncbi:MAG: hypothetical protein AB2L14_01175 [Candidatus Xenobiia bacterium LiM19]